MMDAPKWPLKKILSGMERYKSEYGRYPSTLDLDKVMYLPTSRYVQRNLGGIVALRKLLNLKGENDYTKGEVRSLMAKKLINVQFHMKKNSIIT